MNKSIFFVFILFLAILSGCIKDKPNEGIYPAEKDREFDKGSAIVFPELSEQLIDDLDLLGKIWGFLKYHHPEVGKGNYNWDYELFRILPQYLKVRNNEERDKVLLDWIKKYGKIPMCTTCRETPDDAYIKPDLSWVENSNLKNILKEKIREIYQNRNQGDHFYIQKLKNYNNFEFLHEYPYSTIIFPDAGFRILTLYRYWNIIQYYFPCKYLTDKNWDNILHEYIPMFISVGNRIEYELAVTQLIGEINDTHAIIEGRVKLDELRGNNYAPFQVRFIEGKLVVTLYYNPEFKEDSGLEIGDVITHINGETVESIVENRKKYYPASNEAARLRNMSFDLLRSNQNSITINYISLEQSGQKEIQLYNRNIVKIHDWGKEGWYKLDKNKKCYRLIDEHIGYVTLASIKTEDVSEIKSSFSNTKGIIIDIRNYPSADVRFYLGSLFVKSTTPYVKFTKGNIINPGEFTFLPDQEISYTGETYTGKLMVLVNEITQSHAECVSMAFRAGVNTTIIGSTTAGADGNVSNIDLPGGLQTHFSGLGTYYPDGRPAQRVGIIPDVWCEPTIEGIREGKDELLEMAIKLINEE